MRRFVPFPVEPSTARQLGASPWRTLLRRWGIGAAQQCNSKGQPVSTTPSEGNGLIESTVDLDVRHLTRSHSHGGAHQGTATLDQLLQHANQCCPKWSPEVE